MLRHHTHRGDEGNALCYSSCMPKTRSLKGEFSMKRVLIILSCVVACGLTRADTLTLPATLTNNTTADAAAVQANFDALAEESNENDERISDIDRLISVDDSRRNLALGEGAFTALTSGSRNTAMGVDALRDNTIGRFNVAFGDEALANSLTGSFNVGIGGQTLFVLERGSRNVAVGDFAGPAEPFSSLSNTIAIGAGARVTASNTIRLGDTGITGFFAEVGLTTTSDARLKEQIRPVSNGLALIKDLNPVSYHRIRDSADRLEMGLLAQEVEATLVKHGLDKAGMVHHPEDGGYLSLRYGDLLAPMIRAIQELDDAAERIAAEKDTEIARLEAQIAEQRRATQALKSEFAALLRDQNEQLARLERYVAARNLASR